MQRTFQDGSSVLSTLDDLTFALTVSAAHFFVLVAVQWLGVVVRRLDSRLNADLVVTSLF